MIEIYYAPQCLSGFGHVTGQVIFPRFCKEKTQKAESLVSKTERVQFLQKVGACPILQ